MGGRSESRMARGIEGRNPEKERGTDTRVRFTFLRHAQKKSGDVFAKEGTGLSKSSISEWGKELAAELGEKEFERRRINKAYATQSERTRETLESAFEGAEISPKILQKSETTNAFFAIEALHGSEKFMSEYMKILDEKRDDILEDEFPGRVLADLTPDEQESVMERAEEPALEWYLRFGDLRPDEETPSPREQASAVAWKMNRLIHLPDFMESGKEMDLVSAGHKTSTEAFLKYAIENGKIDDVGFEDLSDIGGSLGTLEGWELEIQNGRGRWKEVVLKIRRSDGEVTRYKLSEERIQELAQEHADAKGIRMKKIDLGKE